MRHINFRRRPTPQNVPGRQQPSRITLPPYGGTLTISILENRATQRAGGGPARTPKARILAELQQRAKLDGARPSDEVEGLKFDVRWEPRQGTLGVVTNQEEAAATMGSLQVVRDLGTLKIVF